MNLEHGGNIFAVSRERGWDWREVLDFSASINPLGPSPRALEAIRASLDRIAHYPEREPRPLIDALATLWNLAPGQILLGNGATDLIHFFARTAGLERVSLIAPAFSEFHKAFPRAAVVTGEWPGHGLVVLTQPVNPTGSVAPLDRYLCETEHPVLIDESFLEFTGEPSAARFLGERPNLWILRSLTKFYALPGLRIGALIGDADAIGCLRRMREPWQVNALAEQAALAAIADREHAERTLEYVARERAWLAGQLATLPGVEPQPSRANYILARLAYPAGPLIEFLLERKILARDCSGWPGVPFRDSVRVAVRRREENAQFIAAWKEYSCAS
jgi:threonine-phosphate decarboxylase